MPNKGTQKIFTWKGLEFDVSNPNVYPPKPASLLLAETAIRVLDPKQKILEVGTGCGVVAIAIAKFVSHAHVVATDINPEAVSVAKQNAQRNNVNLKVLLADLYTPFQDEEFDVIVIHPPAIPYLPETDWGMSKGMGIATNGGLDGSDLLIRFIADAKRCLKKNGKLLLLLPHWSNTKKVYDVLREQYEDVEELARQKIEFFPIIEGKPEAEVLDHALNLAKEGIIELWSEEEKLFSYATVIQAMKL